MGPISPRSGAARTGGQPDTMYDTDSVVKVDIAVMVIETACVRIRASPGLWNMNSTNRKAGSQSVKARAPGLTDMEERGKKTSSGQWPIQDS